MQVHLIRELKGAILDIGGGGEGIIGRLYREQVTAIDISPDELAEAPDCCAKIVMDAREMAFPSESFDHVTAFYSFMFMLRGDQDRVLREAARVLRAGGCLHIWDEEFPAAFPEPFVAELDVRMEDSCIHTAYGIVKNEGQSCRDILWMAEEAGLNAVRSVCGDGHFYICLEKQKA